MACSQKNYKPSQDNTGDKHLRRLDVDIAVRALPPYTHSIGAGI